MVGWNIHHVDDIYQEKFKNKWGFSIAIIYYLSLLECKGASEKKVESVETP